MEWMLLMMPHPQRRYLSLPHVRQASQGAPSVDPLRGSETRDAEKILVTKYGILINVNLQLTLYIVRTLFPVKMNSKS